MSKMTIDKLAEMTQQQFLHVDEKLDTIQDDVSSIKGDVSSLKAGQERILEVLLEIPSKKSFERFQTQVDARFTTVEQKVSKLVKG